MNVKVDEVKVDLNNMIQDDEICQEDMVYFLHKAKNTEHHYRKLKVKYASMKNSKLLSCNWDEINAKRVDEGLPKLTNQTMKDAYIDSLLEDRYEELVEAQVNYHYYNNVLKAKMEKLV